MPNSYSHVVFYNIWGHRVPLGINLYLQSLVSSVDIVCLTEVTHMGLKYDPAPAVHSSEDLKEPPSYINGVDQIIQAVGEDYAIHYFSPSYKTKECVVTRAVYKQVGYGSALLLKKNLDVVFTGHVPIVFKSDRANNRVLQYVIYDKASIRYLVAHLHGVWIKDNTKGDDSLRDFQSAEVLEHLFRLKHTYQVNKIVFGGDLNLALDTRALRKFEYDDTGEPLFRNLIRYHSLNNTRTPRYRKFHVPNETMHADYAFVTPNVEVAKFSVENHIEASDHAPVHVIFR